MSNALLQRAKAVRLAIFDVDGVLTDGRLYFLADGSEFKTFNTLDGHGIKMLIASGVQTAIISGRSSPVVERRAANLGIQHLIQGREDKLVVLEQLLGELGLGYEEVAYLGDDLPDLPVIRRVGLGMAVASADAFVRQHAHGITSAAGGAGAAREFCELIMRAQGTSNRHRRPTCETTEQKPAPGPVGLAGAYWSAGAGLLEHPTGNLPGPDSQHQQRRAGGLLHHRHGNRAVPGRRHPRLPPAGPAPGAPAAQRTNPGRAARPAAIPRQPTPWHVQSTRGEAKGDGSEVELIDNVRIARTDARGRPTLLTTSRLTVFPDKEYAETRQAVRIDAANGVTTAQGMKAYLQDSRMHLLSNVRGQHEVR